MAAEPLQFIAISPLSRPVALHPALEFCMLVAVNQSLNSEPSMHLFKSVVVCVAVAVICGSDISAETPPATTNPTPVELPESTNSIGMEFKLIPAGKFTVGEGNNAHEVTLTEPFKMGIHE
ncbi:MAG: hypothetical protein OSB55_15775, partial [Verrucomicrobiota bacterium]|nr:hypothetical protein [Verrucomicrobiota bacterium]